MPSDCPLGPDGKKKPAPKAGIQGRTGAAARRAAHVPCRPVLLTRLCIHLRAMHLTRSLELLSFKRAPPPAVTMYVSDSDGDEFAEACLPVNLEDDG